MSVLRLRLGVAVALVVISVGVASVTAAGTLVPAVHADVGSSAPVGLRGVVRDAQGSPIADAQVTLTVARWVAGGGNNGSTASTQRHAWSEADGRYAIDDALSGAPVDALWSASVEVRAGNGDPRTLDVLEVLRSAALNHTAAQLDLLAERASATIAGRIAIRPGSEPLPAEPYAGGRVLVHSPDQSSPRYMATTVERDGQYSIDVPPGRYVVSAEVPGGLPATWPDLRGYHSNPPTVTVDGGERRGGIDLSLRARLPYDAFDELGIRQEGWDRSDPRTTSADPANPRCYGRDEYVSAGSTGSRATLFMTPMSLTAQGVPGLVVAGQPFIVFVKNAGDRTLWLDRVRLEGPGAAAYRLPSLEVRERCTSAYAQPGPDSLLFGALIVSPTGARVADRHLTVVVPHDGGELRIAVDPRDAPPRADPVPRPAPGEAAKPATAGAKRPPKRPGTAPTLTALEIGKRALRVHFPSAGQATVSFERRTRGRWRTVRVVRLRSTGTADRKARMPRLAPGPYRVRLTSRVDGQPLRTIILQHRVRR